MPEYEIPEAFLTDHHTEQNTSSFEHGQSSTDSAHTSSESANSDLLLRKSTRVPKPPSFLKDFVLNNSHVQYSENGHWCNLISSQFLSSQHHAFIANTSTLMEPTSYMEACKDLRWVEAMDKELQSLQHNKTWELVPLPACKKPIGCRWVYKIKLKADGSVERFKARLVAKGFNQKWGIDYQEHFHQSLKWPLSDVF